jgi:hypothetical protein
MTKQVVNLGQGIIDLYDDLAQGEIINAHGLPSFFSTNKTKVP